ncbi:MAG: hypothetical protein MJB57_04370, partial [Gemmatimonadetes bacterium]|nr:hypothetical protein [Gemmatimonadota bacterium]
MRRGWPGRPRRTPLCAAALAVSGIGVAELASQQRYEDPRVVVSGDVTFASEYNWRGLTRVNNWVLQPDAYVAADLGALSSGATETIRFSLSAGIWADVEIRDPGPGEHSDRGGPGFGELNPWLQLGAGMGDVDLALGVTPYFYFGDALDFPSARTSASNTTELYLDARTRGRTVDARATWWLDIDEIGGSYFETAATLHIPFVPSFFAPDPVLADLELDAI